MQCLVVGLGMRWGRVGRVCSLLLVLVLVHVAHALRVVVLVSLGRLETEVLVDHEVLAHEEDAEAAHERNEGDERVDVDRDA